jgi:NAD-dependent SIR2 family protein deacetylase
MIPDVLAGLRWLVLTGAGVSTDSGIPDYRGPGSVARSPMTYQEFLGSGSNRRRYWARAHLGWSRMGGAQPNATHHWLAERQRALAGLITQNVDTLHERAGHRDVIDLHGRIDRVRCLDCGAVVDRAALHDRLDALNPGWSTQDAVALPDGDVALEATEGFVLADCEHCAGRLKPDVVFFGESVAKDVVARCFSLVDDAEALVVLGSSLQVMSGLRFVRHAAKRSIPIVIVNRGATRGDDLATVKIDGGVAETLASWGQFPWGQDFGAGIIRLEAAAKTS